MSPDEDPSVISTFSYPPQECNKIGRTNYKVNYNYMKKSILILEACGHIDEPLEVAGIKTQAELYGMEINTSCINSHDDLRKALTEHGDFDYIYLSSHGDNCGFSNENETVNIS